MIPVSAGEMAGPILPMQFWIPTHLPAARGPANVWVTAQTLEVKIPSDTEAATKRTSEAEELFTRSTGTSRAAQSSKPVVMNVFRTRVGEPPRRIQRSESQPPVIEVKAIPQKGREPRTAICFKVRWRASTR